MHLYFENVNEAFLSFASSLHNESLVPTTVTTSRVGEVIQITEPVTITYQNPRQRVLFNEARDANPFFHLYESLWMLAGRKDVKPLDYYSSKIAKIASDDGQTFNGAYGYRWRQSSTTLDWEFPDEPIDQLHILIEHLKTNPDSRRAILQMWNVEDDLLKIDSSKDVCCNLSVCFSVRENLNQPADGRPWEFLDMTVFNRSNDLVLGALGANVVHFSFLQEYMACALGIGVGVYNQISNNLHIYTDNCKPQDWVMAKDTLYPPLGPKLLEERSRFDKECHQFVDSFHHREPEKLIPIVYEEPFLQYVAKPLCLAFAYYKQKKYKRALFIAATIGAPDWRMAAQTWLTKREKAWETRKKKKKEEQNPYLVREELRQRDESNS